MSASQETQFVWDTDFPEPGLSDTLRDLYDDLHNRRDNKSDPTKPYKYLVRDITLVRKVMHHFGVPKEQVGARMEAMGMHTFWEAFAVEEVAILRGVPLREPGDTSPIHWT